jgi:alcohol dehydrogenase class IV
MIAVPTTAGTGSEANGTAIFAGPNHAKLWAAGPALLPAHVVLDPDLTASLPPHLTAWCGLDALVHAFEAATNAHAQPLAQRYALWALAEIPAALPRAMAGDPQARATMLLASFHAGYAIGQCGTAIAHCLSHALAAIAPVHHGLATALAFRATLPWVLGQPAPRLTPACDALGLRHPSQLPDLVDTLFAATAMPDHLPAAFATTTAAELAHHMTAPGCTPMRDATRPALAPADLPRLADGFLAACRPPAALAV